MARPVLRELTPKSSGVASSTSNPSLRCTPAPISPERYSSRPAPVLPERSSLRPGTVTFTRQLEHSASVPSFPSSNRVRFGDVSSMIRAPHWDSTTSTAGNATAKPSLIPKPQITQGEESTSTRTATEFGESSKIRPTPGSLPRVDTPVSRGDPFVDPDTLADLPDLVSPNRKDPFEDVYSISSITDDDSVTTEIPLTDFAPKVHIVDEEDVLSSITTSKPESDLKEDQAYFVAHERFNHPDVARGQFQRGRGMLWDFAIAVLMSSYLHPSDLTENEFVSLVCSQGNSTSKWLKDNTRMISNRRIRARMDVHRELTSLGLPPNQLTDEYLEIYQSMQDSARMELMDWFKNLKEDVTLCEEDLKIDDKSKAAYMGMTFIEKADFIGLENLESMKRERLKRELAEINKIANTNHSLGTENTDSDQSFGESLERMNVHHTHPEMVIAEPVIPETKKPLLSRKLGSSKGASSLVEVVEKIAEDAIQTAYGKVFNKTKASTSGPREVSLNRKRFSFDTNTEVINEGSKTTLSLPRGSSGGIFAKVKSGFFLSRKSHSPRSLKKAQSQRDLQRRAFRISSFDSDAVPLDVVREDVATAKEALFAAPKLVQVTPPASERRTHTTSVEEAPPCPAKSSAVASPSINYETIRIRKVVPDASSYHSASSTRGDDGCTDQVKKCVEDSQTLKLKSSYWKLNLGWETRQSAPGEFSDKDVRKSKAQTLRKMISSIFGSGKDHVQGPEPFESCIEEEPRVRRMFNRRKSIPDWEFSK